MTIAEKRKYRREYMKAWALRMIAGGRCRSCGAARNPERSASKCDVCLDKLRERQRARRQRSDEKRKHVAREAVRQSVKCGRLTKPASCERCGATDRKLAAHHEDYSRPRAVDWLCTGCHGEQHRAAA